MNPGSTWVAVRADGHLWIVLSEPDGKNNVAAVNLTTRRPPCDDTCIVTRGEHPFVTHDSVIMYQYARMWDYDILVDQVGKGTGVRAHRALSSDLLLRIQRGALSSQHTPGPVLAAVQAMLGYDTVEE